MGTRIKASGGSYLYKSEEIETKPEVRIGR